MHFHPTQAQVASDDTRFRIVDCGRQWGKTTLACWEMFGCAVSHKDRRIGYFATTFGQARDIAWKYLKEITAPVWAKEPNESRLELFVKTQDGGISEIVLKGWESVETNRGTQFDLIVLDEVSKMRNFKDGWEGVLLGTLAFRQGKALLISTPYGFNHFHDLYQLGQGNNPSYKSWRFTSFDNPYLPVDYLHTIESTVTKDFWAQEYLADFRRFTGLIYQEFDINTHVHEFDLPTTTENLFGLDFAVRGSTASLPVFIDTANDIWIPDNYKVQSETAQTHSEAIRAMLTRYRPLNQYTGYADPAGFAKNQQKGEMMWALADEYLEADFPITRANNEVVSGINYVRQLFKANKIHIHPRCTLLIDEVLQYQWKPESDSKTEQDEPEKVRKVNDHLLDAMRYAVYSKTVAPDKPTNLTPGMPIVFKLMIDTPDPNANKLTPIDTRDIYD